MPHDSAGKNLTAIVYEKIRNDILINVIKPGERLSENQIAKSFGTSRTPVREAMKMLANEDLVEIYNGSGIFVKNVTLRELSDIFQVRAILECGALELAWGNISKAEIRRLADQWLKKQARLHLGQRVELSAIVALDGAFHRFIYDKCSNSYLSRLLNDIEDKVSRFRFISALSLGNILETINQHLEILELMENNDLEKTLSALKTHIEKAKSYIIENHGYSD